MTDWFGPPDTAVGRSLNPDAAIPAVSVDPAAEAPDSSSGSIAGSGTAGPIDPEICVAGWRRRAPVAPAASVASSGVAW